MEAPDTKHQRGLLYAAVSEALDARLEGFMTSVRWRKALLAGCLTLIAVCGGCTTVASGPGGGGPPPPSEEQRGEPGAGPRGPAGVPPGHLPPPGECRIWYPGDPPGQQPPPGPCDDLVRRVPPGAWLVYGGPKHGNYRVEEYDRQRSGVVISVRLYDVDTGTLISIEKR